MLDLTGFAMHKIFSANNLPTESRANRLMSQANAEQRNFSREMTDHIDADSRFLRSARSWRNQDPFRMHRLDLAQSHLIITPNLNLRAQLTNILDKVVSKRIVIVENKDHVLIVAVKIAAVKATGKVTSQISATLKFRFISCFLTG